MDGPHTILCVNDQFALIRGLNFQEIVTMQSDLDKIIELDEAEIAASKAQNYSTLLTLWDNSVVVLPPSGNPIIRIESLKRWLQGLIFQSIRFRSLRREEMKHTLLLMTATLLILTACTNSVANQTATPLQMIHISTPPPSTATSTSPPSTITPIPSNTPVLTETALPLENLGHILFYSDVGMNYLEGTGVIQAHVMKVDGSEPIWHLGQLDDTWGITWSPDGARVGFAARWDGDAEIYVMNADGSDLVQLTKNAVEDTGPAWSPDGTRIVYSSQRDPVTGSQGSDSDIYVINADGSNQKQLTDNESDDYCPSWSPDGSQVAFSSSSVSFDNGENSHGVYISSAEGIEEYLLADTSPNVPCSHWSPNGSKILLEIRDWRQSNIAVINADNGNLEVLTTFGADYPSWSPDGNWVTFSSDRDGEDDIFIMDVHGSEPVNLTNSASSREFFPVWIPSSATIMAGTVQEEPTTTHSATPCTNLAEFVGDVTIPDGTKLGPGQPFTKTWRYRNIGTCTWTSSYSVIFASGDRMGAFLTPLTLGTVPPGSTVDVSVDLIAPDSLGTSTGIFQLQSDLGEIMTGSGFWVKIEVIELG